MPARSPDLAEILAAGITYRQLDHWTRKGYLRAGTPGSGHRREWSDTELRTALLMGRLVVAGLTLERAAEIAREMTLHHDTSHELAPGIYLDIPSTETDPT